MTTRTMLRPLLAALILWGCSTGGGPDGDDPGSREPGAATASPTDEVAYACPMHPEVTGKKGDNCSKCGMDLEPAGQDAP